MASLIRLVLLFLIIGVVARFYDVSTFAHVATIITLAVMIVLLPEKYHP
jgi:hypothetical protein